MSAPLTDLAKCPINQLLPQAIERLKKASLDELAELLGRGSARPKTDAQPVHAANGDDLARAILALPGNGSKLGAAERAVILHALSTTKGNVSAAARILSVDRKSLERKIRRIKRADKR